MMHMSTDVKAISVMNPNRSGISSILRKILQVLPSCMTYNGVELKNGENISNGFADHFESVYLNADVPDHNKFDAFYKNIFM